MVYSSLLSVGIVVRESSNNFWLDRLLASLESVHSGLPTPEVVLEEGAGLTKVEKKIRVFRRCRTPYLAMLEDDTEILVPGWAAMLVAAFQFCSRVGIVGPLEVGFGPSPNDAAQIARGQVVEAATLGGFCQLLNTTQPICWDVRIQTLDDLYLALLARSLGYRVMLTYATVVRHTKQPWAPDGIPPWEQTDRSRFGVGDAYYEKERHVQKRLSEGRLLLQLFGDLARQTLPQELMAVLEPTKVPTDVSGLSTRCTICQKAFTLNDDFVMVRASFPACLDCHREGKTQQRLSQETV